MLALTLEENKELIEYRHLYDGGSSLVGLKSKRKPFISPNLIVEIGLHENLLTELFNYNNIHITNIAMSRSKVIKNKKVVQEFLEEFIQEFTRSNSLATILKAKDDSSIRNSARCTSKIYYYFTSLISKFIIKILNTF